MATATKEKQEKPVMNGKTPAKTEIKKRTGVSIRLVPVDRSDQPVVSNYSAINVTPGMAFIDFGFLEPDMLATLQRAGKQGAKLPEKVDGTLAVRVALGIDAMRSLHQQLSKVLNGAAPQGRKNDTKDKE